MTPTDQIPRPVLCAKGTKRVFSQHPEAQRSRRRRRVLKAAGATGLPTAQATTKATGAPTALPTGKTTGGATAQSPRRSAAAAGGITGRVYMLRPTEEAQGLEPLPIGVTVPEAVSVPHAPAGLAHAVSLGLRAALAVAAAIGGYVVLHDVLAPLFSGWGAVWRALTPLGVEATLGHLLVASCSMKGAVWLRVTQALGCLLGIGLCIAAELAAASAAPAVAVRARVAAVLSQAAHPAAAVALQYAPAGAGKRGQLQFQQNQRAVLELQARRDEAGRQVLQQQVTNAKESSSQEAWLPTLLAILGAIGSASSMPLLEAFLGALRSECRETNSV